MNGSKPLLDRARRERVRERLLELASALARPHDEWALSRRPDATGLRSVSLALGRGGTAVFETWAYRTGLDPAAGDRAVGRLQEIVEIFPTQTMDLSLLCGFPSVAWTVEHLVRGLDLDLGGDLNAGIDDAILQALAASDYRPAYDLIDGIAGLLLYAIERRERPRGAEMMDTLLGHLEALAVEQSTGIAWPSGQVTRAAHRRQVQPGADYFNLGLSHGVPGVVGALARVHALDDWRDRVASLLADGAEWLCVHRLPGDPGSRGLYPDFVAPGQSPEPARLAWCYGDPGVAAALVAASTALDREDLLNAGLDAAHAAAARETEGCGVVDDGICHGTAGLVHAFHRLYRATGDEHCGRAALTWLDRLLARKDDRPNIAGLTTFCFERTVDGETIDDPAWLTGAAGIGLVLISLLTGPDEIMPDWDRPLLLDLGP